MTKRKKFNFNIFFLLFAVLWRMINEFYLGGIDGAGRLYILMMAAAICVNGKAFLRTPRAMLVWGVWIVYVIICAKIKGFYSDNGTFATWAPKALLMPFISLQVAYFAVKYDFEKTLRWVFYAYVVFVILGALHMGVSESNADRLTNDLGNYYFNNALLLATYASLFFSLGKIKKVVYYALLAIVLYAIYISGERKGLVCVFIIIMGSLYAKNYGKGIKTLLYTMGLALVAFVAVSFAMANSVAGARMDEAMSSSAFQDNLFLKLMGDRGIMYYEGWEVFLDNIWTGIGIRNFCWQNSFFYGLPLHTEYMVQLTECGLCGTSLFLLFHFGLIKRLSTGFKSTSNKTIPIILISTYVAIMVINLVSWTYTYFGYFMVFGFIYAYFDNSKLKRSSR